MPGCGDLRHRRLGVIGIGQFGFDSIESEITKICVRGEFQYFLEAVLKGTLTHVYLPADINDAGAIVPIEFSLDVFDGQSRYAFCAATCNRA